MGNLFVKDIINNLLKYKEILTVLDSKKLKSNLMEIDNIINSINSISDICLDDLQPIDNNKGEVKKAEKNKKVKIAFEEIVKDFLKGDFNNIKGVKLDYTRYSNSSEIILFITNNTKEQVLKSTTLLDLNILYFVLSDDPKEIKKKKEELYDMITSHIKAYKQGEAFGKYTNR